MFSKIFRIFTFLLVGLLVLGAGAAGAVYLISSSHINRTYTVAGKAVPVPTDLAAEADFFKSLRTGIRPDGTPIDIFMPWPLASRMTDDEIKAVWAYLKTVPPKPTGNR